ncbi:MAG TPA: hypothetical protein VFC65_00555 [Prolixibacteraceae bacterium]|nr:hypothetical protein [Prolixibacteraceae bacterium]
MQFHIKNMVCNRCILVVSNIFKDAEFKIRNDSKSRLIEHLKNNTIDLVYKMTPVK